MSVPGQIARSKPRDNQPSERADHASLSARGRHLGAGDDNDADCAKAPTAGGSAGNGGAAAGSPSAGTQAATTQVAQRVSPTHPGGTSTPPPVIVEPPAAPQPGPQVGADEVLIGAGLDWILVGVVIALAAAVVVAVRVATHRGRRPPG